MQERGWLIFPKEIKEKVLLERLALRAEMSRKRKDRDLRKGGISRDVFKA